MHNNRLKKSIFLTLVLLITAMILSAVVFAAEQNADIQNQDASASESVPEENRITSVKILDSHTLVEVRVKLTEEYVKSHSTKPVYIFELLPYQSTSKINDLEPVGMMSTMTDVTFSVSFDNTELRAQAKYIVAERSDNNIYSIITKAKFIENPEILAKYTDKFPLYESKKGLSNVTSLTDAADLCISHTLIDIPINEYIGVSKTDGMYEYTFGGSSYYINRAKLELLDWKIKYFTNAGVNIYLNLTLSKPYEGMPEELKSLYCENTSPEALLYALNTRDENAVMYYTSFVSFIAKRYANVKGSYGFAGNFVLGYNLNSNRYWNAMGEKSLAEYMDMYITAFRIADTALRSVYTEGRCYISLYNNLNSSSTRPGKDADELLDYSAADFLSVFNTKINSSSNIPWKVMLNIFPTVENNAKFWEEPNIDDTASTPFVNMYNINSLTKLLQEDEYLYYGVARKIAVNLALPSEDNSQSAAYAYSYFTAELNEGIESLLFYRHDDSAQDESAFGLRSVNNSKKNIYDVFKNIDTNLWASQTRPLAEYLGEDLWDDIIPGFNSSTYQGFKNIIIGNAVKESQIEREYKKVPLVDFSSGDLQLFTPSDNAEYIEPYKTEPNKNNSFQLYAKFNAVGGGEYAGISKPFPLTLGLQDTKYITLNLKILSSSSSNATISLWLMSDGEYTYKAYSSVPVNEQTTLSFDLLPILEAGYTSVDDIKILVSAESTGALSGIYLGNIETRSIVETNSIEIFLIIAIGVVSVIICVTIIIIIVIRIRSSRTGLVDSEFDDDAESAYDPDTDEVPEKIIRSKQREFDNYSEEKEYEYPKTNTLNDKDLNINADVIKKEEISIDKGKSIPVGRAEDPEQDSSNEPDISAYRRIKPRARRIPPMEQKDRENRDNKDR